MQIRPFMPSALKQTIDYMIRPAPLSQKQHDKIASLGESVGLNKAEVIQAVDAPGIDSTADGAPRMALVASVVIVLIAAAITIIGLWHLISPATSPIPTYTPGTDYGTIKPKDFDVLKREANIASGKDSYPLFYKMFPR